MSRLFFSAVIAVLGFCASVHAELIFSSDFQGAKPWNFSETTDPSNQIGGTDRFEFTTSGSAASGYVTQPIDLSQKGDEAGTVKISGRLDLSGIQLVDAAQRPFLELVLSKGLKSPFETRGGLYSLRLRGSPGGKFGFIQITVPPFRAGSRANSPFFLIGGLASDPIVDFVAVIVVAREDTRWTVTATTTFSASDGNPIKDDHGNAIQPISSSFQYDVKSANDFKGLHDITGLRIGFSPATADGGGQTLVIDDIKLELVPTS